MANLNLNKVILAGRLVADPELRQTASGIFVTSCRIAISRRFVKQSDEQNSQQQTADFIDLVAWRQTAQFICGYFRKGSSICVTGSIQTRSWTDQQGQKRYSTEVVVDEAMFVDSKGEGPAIQNPGSGYTAAPAYSSAPNDAPKFEEISSDDDLPF